MGVSAKLLVNAKWNVKHIETLLVDGLGLVVSERVYNADHSFLQVEHRDQTSRLYIARSNEYGGLDGLIISTGSRTPNIELLKDLSKVLGGFLQEQDCDSDWVETQEPHNGNARFVLEHTILTDALSDSKALADKVAESIGYDRKKAAV
jgi:hypothetical protein